VQRGLASPRGVEPRAPPPACPPVVGWGGSEVLEVGVTSKGMSNRRGRRIRMDQPAGLATPSHIRIG
jgi:hypothetical protein